MLEYMVHLCIMYSICIVYRRVRVALYLYGGGDGDDDDEDRVNTKCHLNRDNRLNIVRG